MTAHGLHDVCSAHFDIMIQFSSRAHTQPLVVGCNFLNKGQNLNQIDDNGHVMAFAASVIL